MTDTQTINIQVLHSLHLENLMGLPGEKLNQILEGSDLVYDEASQTLKNLSQPHQPGNTLQEEAGRISALRQADQNGDQYLEASELEAFWGPEKSGNINLTQFMSGVEKLIELRYGKILSNLKRLNAENQFSVLIQALEIYSSGIYQDEVRHANSILPLNGLTKSLCNGVMALGLPWYTLVNGVLPEGWKPDGKNYAMGDTPLLIGDALAEAMAYPRYQKVKGAIQSLKYVITRGIQAGEPWVLEGNLAEALRGVGRKFGSEEQRILTQELPTQRLHGILRIQDSATRYRKMDGFAQGERPFFLGQGGGNTSGLDNATFFNYTGNRNNTDFASSFYEALLKEIRADGSNKNAKWADLARRQFASIRGDTSSGYYNITAATLSRIFSLGGLLFEPTPYRNWSDQAKMDGIGRFLNGGLVLFGTFKYGPQAIEQIHRPFRSLWSRTLGRVRRRPKEGARTKFFSDMPPRFTEVAKKIMASKSGESVYRSLLGLGVMSAADHALKAPENPYEFNTDLDLRPWPDPLEPDPALAGAP